MGNYLTFSQTQPINWKLSNDSYTTSFSNYLSDRGGELQLKTAGLDTFYFWSDDGVNIYGKLV